LEARWVLDHDVGGPAFAPHIGMEVGGEEARRVGAVHHHLRIRPQIEVLPVEEALAHPRAVRAIVEARGVAIGGDGDGAVLAVIGDVPPVQGAAGPVQIVRQRVAIGVVSAGCPAASEPFNQVSLVQFILGDI
jgi:hypothetical protein